jgi:hypothetical protein
MKKDYPYIEAWGKLMHSYPYYIAGEKERARADKAPQDALYKDDQMHWVTLSEIKDTAGPGTIEILARYLEDR